LNSLQVHNTPTTSPRLVEEIMCQIDKQGPYKPSFSEIRPYNTWRI
jgi:hypothetical protein